MKRRPRPPGYLVYIKDRILTAVRFDIERLRIIPPEIITGEHVFVKQDGAAVYSISNNGSLVYVEQMNEEDPSDYLTWVDEFGNSTKLDWEPGNIYRTVRISPEANRLVLSSGHEADTGSFNLWISDIDGTNAERITFQGRNVRPVWSPDGKHIAYRADHSGNGDIYMKATDGQGEARLLYGGPTHDTPTSWSPDGQYLLFYVVTAEDRDIWLLDVTGSARPLLDSPFNERAAVFSPDGQWIAYTSDESGRDEVYVMPAPDTEFSGKWPISEGGGIEPAWAHDSRHIYYRTDTAMMKVGIETSPVFRKVSSPQQLFENRNFLHRNGTSYDIHPHTGQFLMLEQVSIRSNEATINVVINWPEELTRLLPDR